MKYPKFSRCEHGLQLGVFDTKQKTFTYLWHRCYRDNS